MQKIIFTVPLFRSITWSWSQHMNRLLIPKTGPKTRRIAFCLRASIFQFQNGQQIFWFQPIWRPRLFQMPECSLVASVAHNSERPAKKPVVNRIRRDSFLVRRSLLVIGSCEMRFYLKIILKKVSKNIPTQFANSHAPFAVNLKNVWGYYLNL